MGHDVFVWRPSALVSPEGMNRFLTKLAQITYWDI